MIKSQKCHYHYQAKLTNKSILQVNKHYPFYSKPNTRTRKNFRKQTEKQFDALKSLKPS